jgi:hypothetical protein
MKVEFDVSSGTEALKQLVTRLFGEEDAHGERCLCVECAAGRMAQETYSDARPSDEDMVDVIQQRIFKVARKMERLGASCHDVCVGTVEKPTRLDCDDAVYRLRVEEYNACARCIETLWSMLPADKTALPDGVTVPKPITWEEALATRERIRGEIMEAVENIHRNGKQSVGPELAELLKAALKRGRSREDVAEILQTAADSVRAPREEAPSPPAP